MKLSKGWLRDSYLICIKGLSLTVSSFNHVSIINTVYHLDNKAPFDLLEISTAFPPGFNRPTNIYRAICQHQITNSSYKAENLFQKQQNL